MNPRFTVLLPHKISARNTDALNIAIDMLARNTRNPFAVLMTAHEDQPLFATMNALVKHAPTDICVFSHSDIFFSLGWDVAMLEVYDSMTFVTGLLVEPGAMGLHENNHMRDFGRRPELFRRAEFEEWAQSEECPRARGEGWYAPYMFSRSRFLDLGGHNLDDPEGVLWTPLDIKLFELHKARGGRVVQAQAPAYHLQRWSEPSEQEKRI